MKQLLHDIAQCKICSSLPLGPNPIIQCSAKSTILIIGQAPGKAVHLSSVPWDDPSGDRLRLWLGVDKKTFYDPDVFGLIPMGFCYPGKGKSGDLPPRPECAPHWHQKIMDELNHPPELIILVGKYAQQYYLNEKQKPTLTETVRSFEEYLPTFLPLPHPSPRNNIWLKKNSWFDATVLPELQQIIRKSPLIH